MAWTERHEVTANYDGWRLDRFLTEKLKRASRAKVARILKGTVTLESGRKVKAGTIVRTGDAVLLERVERGDPDAPPLDAVRVLHADDSLVVLAKPAGMLVHRTAHEATRTVESFLTASYPDERVEAVHRLDRDTSGVLLCGRGLPSIRALTAQFEGAEPRKTYRGMVDDPRRLWAAGEHRTFDAPLGFDASSVVQLRVGPGTWQCATHAASMAWEAGRAELSVRIERGRQHQIRAHLSMFGTPIVGDKLYGMGDAFFQAWVDAPGDPALVSQLSTRWHCLHAERLELERADGVQVFDAGPPPWALKGLLRVDGAW